MVRWPLDACAQRCAKPAYLDSSPRFTSGRSTGPPLQSCPAPQICYVTVRSVFVQMPLHLHAYVEDGDESEARVQFRSFKFIYRYMVSIDTFTWLESPAPMQRPSRHWPVACPDQYWLVVERRCGTSRKRPVSEARAPGYVGETSVHTWKLCKHSDKTVANSFTACDSQASCMLAVSS